MGRASNEAMSMCSISRRSRSALAPDLAPALALLALALLDVLPLDLALLDLRLLDLGLLDLGLLDLGLLDLAMDVSFMIGSLRRR
jgi:hypothetical protein